LFLIRFSCLCKRQRGCGCLAIWFVDYSRVRRREAPLWVTVKRQKMSAFIQFRKKKKSLSRRKCFCLFSVDNIYHSVNTSYNLLPSA
jgi:hypothetical protein